MEGSFSEEHEQQKPLDLNSEEDAGVQCPGSVVHSMMSVPPEVAMGTFLEQLCYMLQEFYSAGYP